MDNKLNQKVPGRAWLMMLAAWLTLFCSTYGSYSIGIVLPSLTQEFGITTIQSGWLTSMSFVIPIALTIPITAIAGRIKPKLLIGIVTICATASLFVYATAAAAPALFIGRALMAVSLCGTLSPLAYVKGAWVPESKMSGVSSVESCFNSGGMLVGTATPAFLIALFGSWRPLMIILAVACLIGCVCWFIFCKDNPEKPFISSKQKVVPLLKEAATKKFVICVVVGCACSNITWAVFLNFWPSYAISTGMTPQLTGILAALIPLGSVLASALSPKICEKIGRYKIMYWPFAIIDIIVYLIALNSTNPFVIAICFLIGGWGCFVFVPLTAIQMFKVPGLSEGGIAIGTSMFYWGTNVGAAIGSILIGYLATAFGLKMGMMLCIIPTVIYLITGLIQPEYGAKGKK